MNPYQAADPQKFAEIEVIASKPGYASTFRHSRPDLLAWIDAQLFGKLDVVARKLRTKIYWITHGLRLLVPAAGGPREDRCRKRAPGLEDDAGQRE